MKGSTDLDLEEGERVVQHEHLQNKRNKLCTKRCFGKKYSLKLNMLKKHLENKKSTMKYTESKKHLDPEELPLCSRLAWCGGRRLAPSPIASPVPNLGCILSCKNTS